MRKPDPVVAKRVEFIVRLKLSGAMNWDVVSLVNTSDGEPFPEGHGVRWGVSIQTVRRYGRMADDLIAAEMAATRPRLMGFHHASRRTLYNRALQANDTRTALAVLDSEAKLLRLFDTPAPPDPAGMTDDQIDAEVRKLTAPDRPGEAGGPDLGEGEADGGGGD